MRAKDVMAEEVICINVKKSVFDAAELLLGAGVSAVPVVDDKGAVAGIVSKADLIRRAEIDTATKKSWLARLLDSEALAARVVIRADLLRAFLSREPDSMVLQPTDKARRQAVVEAIEHRLWTSEWQTNVFANDGVVHLWGFVDGEEVRKAHRVAAENMPGVRRVKDHLRARPASVGVGV